MNPLWISFSIATLAEIFPEWGLSYFLPRHHRDAGLPNHLDEQYYDEKLYCRMIGVSIVWGIITYNLYNISRDKTLVAVSLIMYGFYLKRGSKQQKESDLSRMIFLMGFLIISNIIGVESFVPILTLLAGGTIISKGRGGDILVDYIGRGLFTLGYWFFISNFVSKST